jgi:hypothetical protein
MSDNSIEAMESEFFLVSENGETAGAYPTGEAAKHDAIMM